MRALVTLILICFATSGCLSSSGPLIESHKTSAWLGTDAWFGASVKSSGQIDVSQPSIYPKVAAYWWSGSQYGQSPIDRPAKMSLATHHDVIEVVNLGNDSALLQLTNEGKQAADYAVAYKVQNLEIKPAFLASAIDQVIAIERFDLNSAQAEELQKKGVQISSISDYTWRVESEDDLRIAADYVSTERSGLMYLAVASGNNRIKALQATLHSYACLSLAGHKNDQHVKQLNGSYKWGIALSDINISEAIATCTRAGTAPDRELRDSVTYALARAYFQAESYERAKTLLPDIQNYPMAYILEADMLARGNGFPASSIRKALKTLDHAIARFKGRDQWPLINARAGLAFQSGSESDQRDSRVSLRRIAEAGSDDAKLMLASYLLTDKGGNADPSLAQMLLIDVRNNGNPYGHLALARAYYFGTHQLTKNYNSAYEMVEIASEQLHSSDAYYLRGFMEMYGQGTDVNAKVAVKYFRMASQLSNASATGELGIAYIEGKGVDADTDLGENLLRRAARAGDVKARNYIKSNTQIDPFFEFALLRNRILDAKQTAFLLVDGSSHDIGAPKDRLDKDGRILLNIGESATGEFHFGESEIKFSAKFSGKNYSLSIPINQVMKLYAKETGEGISWRNGVPIK